MLEVNTAHNEIKNKFKTLNCCVIIPTYNNSKTIESVITSTLNYCDDIILVDDGCTDDTKNILLKFPQLTIVTHSVNKGKGKALRNGFNEAVKKGFDYAISIDSDGQHFPKDFETFLNKIEQQPQSLIVGARNMTVENVPNKSNFGNKVSNFWFKIETGITLPDTQSGFRLYPVKKLKSIFFFTTKFEFEIEVMVKAAWHGIPVISVPVHVYYPPQEERVSHFVPRRDSLRISFLNSYLVLLAFLFWKPVMFIRSLSYQKIKHIWKEEVVAAHESIEKKAFSVAVGLFFGIVPLWGFQFALAIFTAIYFKLNKVIVGLTAQISVPPLIPFVLYGSIKMGEIVLNKSIDFNFSKSITLNMVHQIGFLYLVGATVLSVAVGLIGFIFTWLLLKLTGYQKSSDDRKS